VEWLVCFNDPSSYTDCNIATGTASHVKQICGKKPDEEANLNCFKTPREASDLWIYTEMTLG